MIKNKIAIDIVLLFPDEINKLLYTLNSKIIPEEGMEHYIIDGVACFPHISLLMGITEAENIDFIKEKLFKIAQRYLPLNIRFTHIQNVKFPYLAIKPEDNLINFQKEIAREIKLDYDANKNMFVNSNISDAGVEWVNEYKKNNIEKYNLHTTIGLGDVSMIRDVEFPIDIELCNLAITQLGVYCSCRKILAEVNLL